MRIRAIRVQLTPHQRALLRQATGEDVREAIIAAPVDHDEPLESELDFRDQHISARILWDGTATFLQDLGQYPIIQACYEEYIEHPVDRDEPAIALLR